MTPTIKLKCDTCNGTGEVEVSSLAYLRTKADLSQDDVAKYLGLTRSSIANIEAGRQSVSLDKVKPLSVLYGVEEYVVYEAAKATFDVRVEE